LRVQTKQLQVQNTRTLQAASCQAVVE